VLGLPEREELASCQFGSASFYLRGEAIEHLVAIGSPLKPPIGPRIYNPSSLR